MRKATIFIVGALLLTLFGTPVNAADMPPLPHAFYGDVTINGSPAPPGTTVSATGEGIEPGTYNPITTTEAGKYGSADPLGAKLIVQGDVGDGTTITFYVNGVSTGQTYPFDSGETTELPLSVTIAVPPEVPPEAPTPTIEVSLLGTVVSFSISDTGIVQETIKLTSADGNITITIPKGTKALDKYGEPLSSLTADVDPSPPDAPEGYTIIGLVYDFEPEGATFDPPITITFTYDPDEVPEGTDEEDLEVREWDKDAGAWVELEDYTVNTVANTITASISHFSKYAIVASAAVVAPPPPVAAPAAFSLSNLTVQPTEVEPGELVTITVSVANTGGTEGSYTVVLKLNGVKEAEKSVTVAAGGSEIVTFSTSKTESGSYSVTVDGLNASFTVVAPEEEEEVEEVVEEEVPPPTTNWALIIGAIVAGVVVVALLVYFLWIRRRAY